MATGSVRAIHESKMRIDDPANLAEVAAAFDACERAPMSQAR